MSPQKIILFFCILFFSSVVNASADASCNGCADCTDRIANASAGDIIKLTMNLGGISSTCIDFNGTDNITFDCQNNYINGSDSGIGIYLSAANGGSNYNTIRNCNIINFDKGIFLSSSSNNNLFDITVNNNSDGIQLYYSGSNTFTSVTSNSNTQYGIHILGESDNNSIKNSHIENNNKSGLYLDKLVSGDVEYNLIYNNYFNNTRNIKIDSGISNTNHFNTTSHSGINIIGGLNIGGNFWTNPTEAGWSDTCTDSNSDGICDEPYNLSNGTSEAWDYLPLTPLTSTISCYSCSECSAVLASSTWGEIIFLGGGAMLSTNGSCMDISTDGITLNCNGSVIVGNGNGDGIFVNGTNNKIINCTIINFTNGINVRNQGNILISNNLSWNKFGVRVNNGSDVSLIENSFHHNSNISLFINQSVGSSNINLRNNKILWSGGDGILMGNMTDCFIMSNTVSNSARDGMHIDGMYKCLIANNTVGYNSNCGLCLSDLRGMESVDNEIIKLKSTGNSHGVCTRNSSGNIFHSITVLNSTNSGIKFEGISLNNLFVDCVVNNSLGNDLYVDGTSGQNQHIDNTFINTTLREDRLVFENCGDADDLCILHFRWYLDVSVDYSNGSAAGETTVKAYNRTGDLAAYDTTDIDGYVRLTLTEADVYSVVSVPNYGTPIFHSNYTINASQGKWYGEKPVNMTFNQEINLVLHSAPSLDYYELYPMNPYTDDDLILEIKCSDPDNNSLIAYWKVWNNSVEVPSLWNSKSTPDGTKTSITVVSPENTSVGENWTLEVWCGDGIQNTTHQSTSTRTIQSMPPYVVLIHPSNTSIWNNNSPIPFTYTVFDVSTHPIAKCHLYINGVLNKTTTSIIDGIPQTINQTLPDGLYHWSIHCFDTLGVEGISETWLLNVSVPSLSVGIHSPVNGSTYSSEQVLLNTSVSGGSGSYTCWYSLDNWSTNTSYNCSTSVVNCSQGLNIVRVGARDYYLNLTNTTESVSFMVITITTTTTTVTTTTTTVSSGGSGGGGGGGPTPPRPEDGTCFDGLRNCRDGLCEETVDCGGPCPPCLSCSDGIQNQGEEGIDCGGPCPPCGSCNDSIRNQDETDIDCGGLCPGCENDKGCVADDDCLSGYCYEGMCSTPTCYDGIHNQDEIGIDCEGVCPPCHCFDGIQNEDETRIDCGGAFCPPCGCFNGIQDGDETDIDCGGSCEPCEDGGKCAKNDDCISEWCHSGVCKTATCYDRIKNQNERGTDCGGVCRKKCKEKSSQIDETREGQTGNITEPSCFDGVRNQGETGVDCGGSCKPCPLNGSLELNVVIPQWVEHGATFAIYAAVNATGSDFTNVTAELILTGDFIIVNESGSIDLIEKNKSKVFAWGVKTSESIQVGNYTCIIKIKSQEMRYNKTISTTINIMRKTDTPLRVVADAQKAVYGFVEKVYKAIVSEPSMWVLISILLILLLPYIHHRIRTRSLR